MCSKDIRDEFQTGEIVASKAELRTSETAEVVDLSTRRNNLSAVPPRTHSGGAAEAEVELSGSSLGLVLTKEPPSGFYVRARFADHHTAAFVWHRDDAEGHPPSTGFPQARVWWSHEDGKWVSWQDIVRRVTQSRGHSDELVLEPLFPTPVWPTCRPDGMHDERCRPTAPKTVK